METWNPPLECVDPRMRRVVVAGPTIRGRRLAGLRFFLEASLPSCARIITPGFSGLGAARDRAIEGLDEKCFASAPKKAREKGRERGAALLRGVGKAGRSRSQKLSN